MRRMPVEAGVWQQWRHPQYYRVGHSVSPLRPGQGCNRLRRRGGVLFLVLVCMTMGCTGSRARERAAVTAPPPPAAEKIAVNGVGGSKAKPSAPPRSKAKGPAATVKPAAPQPAPPQQGEEQEGRVF